jgi:uncharacterized protein (DUF433 family)
MEVGVLTKTTYEHIGMDESNRPFIIGTTIKVIEIAADHLFRGWDALEIKFQYPHLQMSQIYSALAYYWDHKDVMDEQLKNEADEDERLWLESKKDDPLRKRLKAQGLI